MRYFSERERGERPRDSEKISANAWRGILVLMLRRADDGSFGAKYPDICPDGTFVCGANMGMFDDAMLAEVPSLDGTLGQGYSSSRRTNLQALGNPDGQLSTLDMLDLIEFCWKSVGKPIEIGPHSFFSHYHIKFDEQAGRDEFRDEVNTIFRRNGIAYALTEHGRIERLVPTAFHDMLQQRGLNTGDAELDRLLDAAQNKFLNPRPDARQEALESLWDAWERLKTLDGQGNKRARAKLMLDKAAGESSPKFRDALDREADSLTRIGNSLRIRHSETNQELVASNEHADYLFYRLYSLIRLIIRSRK